MPADHQRGRRRAPLPGPGNSTREHGAPQLAGRRWFARNRHMMTATVQPPPPPSSCASWRRSLSMAQMSWATSVRVWSAGLEPITGQMGALD